MEVTNTVSFDQVTATYVAQQFSGKEKMLDTAKRILAEGVTEYLVDFYMHHGQDGAMATKNNIENSMKRLFDI